MQPLKRKIEDRSISALRTLIDDHPTMEEFFQKCDKGLSWDGHIRLYQNDESANDKANYDDDVPVQIKGHVVKEEQFLNNERITTPVSLEDLRVYYRSFGCIYFVIYMNKDASALEIYYSSLYPSKIKRYLEAASQKGNKSSISIPFLKLEKNSMELYHICKQFSFEMAKQGSGKGQIVPNSITFEKTAQVNQITATSIGVSTPYDFLKGISSGDIAFYGSIDSSGIQYPIQAKMSASLKQTIESPIYIKNKQYYSSFELRTIVTDPDQKNYVRDGTHIISPSPNLSLRITKSQINFTFRFETDLIHLKKDAEFVLNLLKEQKLGIFDGQMWLNNPIIGKEFINQLYNIVAIGTVLDEINCNIMVPYKDLTDEDWKQIDLLCKIKDGHISFNSKSEIIQYTWVFRDKCWPILIDLSCEEVKLCGFVFKPESMFSIGTEENEKTIESPPKGPYVVPNFLPLDSKVLADLYWYDYESMYEQIDYAEVNEYTSEELNNLALKLITAYDLSQNEKLLDIANYLLLKMSSALDNAYECIINMCQIDLRKAAALTQENRIKLKEVEKSLSSEQQPDNPNFLPAYYCIAVVNRDINKADKLYNSFTDADRIIVDKWPIRTLHLLLPSIIETSE